MNIETLQKANKIFIEINKIDTEIKELEKVAHRAAEGKTFSFELTSENKNNPNESDSIPAISFFDMMSNVQKHGFDPRHGAGPSGIGMWNVVSTKEDTKSILKNKINETITLQILGILLGDKLRKKDLLLSELEELGVSTNSIKK